MRSIFGRKFRFEWDDAKAESNLKKHRVSFDQIHAFDFDSSETEEDNRRDYGEVRYVSLGLIGRRLHALVFTPRDLDTERPALRVISLRKANIDEIDEYERSKTDETG